MIALRDYQTRAIDAVRSRIAAGVSRFVLQAPTGAGKTLCAAQITLGALAKRRRVLLTAHRVELINQLRAKILEFGVPADRVGILRAGDARRAPDAPVQVASIDSLHGYYPRADVVIIDEAHRSAAATYVKLFDHYAPSRVPGDGAKQAVMVGLTATPGRLDGKPLDMYDEIVVVAQPSELVAAGWILAPRIFTVPAEMLPDLTDVRSLGGDYNQKQLSAAVNKRPLVGSIVDHWLRRAEGRRTLAFGAGVEHSKSIRDTFVARGVAAVHVDGSTPEAERLAAVEGLRTGAIKVLCNAELFVEGLDVPEAKCLVMARPTQSLTYYLQKAGRICRPWNGETSMILDHAGNARVHGLPTEDRVYSLTGKTRRPKGEVRVRTCPTCYAVISLGTRACECGASFIASGRHAPKVVEGELVELPVDVEEVRRSFWTRTANEAVRLGYKPGWARHKYRERFGEWPPHSAPWPEAKANVEASDAARRAELTKLRAIAFRADKPFGWVEERYHAAFGEDTRDLVLRETTTRNQKQREPAAMETTQELDVGL